MTNTYGGHDDRWRDHGACSNVLELRLLGVVARVRLDPNLWFPEQGSGVTARRICAACPVRVDCLEHAIGNREEFGIWGGAGEFTRRHLAAVKRSRRRYVIEVDDYFARLDEFVATGAQPAGAVISFGPGATHGRKSTYKRGCRGALCQRAMGLAPKGLLCEEYLEALGRIDLLPAVVDDQVLADVRAWRETQKGAA